MRLSFLEEVDNVQTAGTRTCLRQRGERKVPNSPCVFWVVGDEDFDEQHPDEVSIVVGGVDGDARVALRQDGVHHTFVQDGVRAHGEDVLHGRHDVANGLVLQVEDRIDNGDLVLHQPLPSGWAQRFVEGDESLQPSLLVHRPMILA